MKRTIVIAAGALALMAGSAYAGGEGGCIYGHGSAQVAEGDLDELVIDETDPKLLALLKEQEEAAKLEKIMQSPVLHN